MVTTMHNEVSNCLDETFEQLSVLDDTEIDAFIKRTADTNRTRTNAQQVNFSGRFIMDLKATLFELTKTGRNVLHSLRCKCSMD